MIVFLVVFTVTTLAFYFKTLRLLHYTIGCLRNIKNDNVLQRRYALVVDGAIIDNIKMSPLKVLYLYIAVPKEVELPDHQKYVLEHLSFLDKALEVQNLYGLVRSEIRRFNILTDEKAETYSQIYLAKFKPVVYGLKWWRLITTVLISITMTCAIYYFDLLSLI